MGISESVKNFHFPANEGSRNHSYDNHEWVDRSSRSRQNVPSKFIGFVCTIWADIFEISPDWEYILVYIMYTIFDDII